MIPYQEERYDNAICYFAKEHARRTGRPTYQTYVYKYLALFDFECLEKTGQPALDICYDAHENGPVPEVYNRRHKCETELYEFKRIPAQDPEEKYVILPKQDPDLDYFSDAEIEIMENLIETFAQPGTTTQPIIDASHSIRAYEKAWNRRRSKKARMHYKDHFDNLDSKREEDLTPTEESFLVFNALKHHCK